MVVRTLLALGTVVQEKELANLLLLFPGSCDVAEQAVDSLPWGEGVRVTGRVRVSRVRVRVRVRVSLMTLPQIVLSPSQASGVCMRKKKSSDPTPNSLIFPRHLFFIVRLTCSQEDYFGN